MNAIEKCLFLMLIGIGFSVVAARGQENTAASPNLIPNSGFEEVDAEGWPTHWTGPTDVFSLCKEGARTGAHCMRYENNNPERYALLSAPVRLEPGCRYELSGWVRTKDVEGKGTGAAICVEWHGADDQFRGGRYLKGVSGTTNEWTRIYGVSQRIPAEAVRCHVLCYLRRDMTGTAWWDDVSLRVYRGPMLRGITSNRYRGETDGGDVVVKFGLNLGDYDLTPGDVNATLAIKAADGAVVQTVPGAIDDTVGSFEFDSTPMPPGQYTLECAVSSKDGRFRSTASLPLKRFAERPKRKAWFDERRRLILDGEPFFPLGMYTGGVKVEDLDFIAASPFNCLMPYGSPDRDGLDKAHERGVWIIYSVKGYYAGTKYCPKRIRTPADERPAIEDTVNAVKDHPAIMAWYINDELPATMMDRLNAHHDWLEELDPQRPTWVVLYQKDQVPDYIASFDVIGTDPYPIPERPAGTALEYTRKTVAGTFGLRPVWMVPQVFNWIAYPQHVKPGVTYRPPTLLEMRSMAWQCIAGGANGLIFYSYSVLRRTKEDPFEQRWQDVSAMAEEIKRFIPVLLSIEPIDPPEKVDAPEAVAWRLHRKDGRAYLFTVNSGDEPATATFVFAKPWSACDVLVGERNAAQTGNTLKVPYAPLEPKVIALQPAE